jgi:PAS domain S-box-containing protein
MESTMNEYNSVRILIAEDSRTQAEQLRFLLEQHGYQVTVTADGKQALQAAMAEKPALLISDIVMPEMDGYELCKAIKSDETLKDIPVILVTSLSDSHDVILGLECGADNFIRKPYDGDYLISRIHYLLINLELRKVQKMQLGMEIDLNGHKHFINAERQQILDLLISTYEQAVQVNQELIQRDKELIDRNKMLNGLYSIADGLNRTDSELAVVETALSLVLELPEIQAGWIWLRDGESGFRLAAAHNLPTALGELPDALDGHCACQRKLLCGELDSAVSIIECEQFAKAMGETRSPRHHASIPLLTTNHNALGVMNLVGSEDGLLDETALKILFGIGNQVSVALDRARLHEHLEQLVKERTARLTEEVEERIRIQEEQARLMKIIEATPDFVSYVDVKDTHFVFINKAGRKMTGLSEDEDVTQLKFADILPERAIIVFNDEIAPEAIRNGKWEGDFVAFNRNIGREFPVSMVLLSHKAPGGETEFFSTIARDITLRKLAEEKIIQTNSELEQYVDERTAELAAANKELEAFAYSVSHDLRAPLRSINGFSQLLLEDYAEKIDAEGKDYLQRVRAASQRMGQLIDDLLNLSRVTRSKLVRTTIDLSALARKVATELQQGDPDRKVEFVIQDGMAAKGDERLLQVVLENLLGNAWKYTSRHASARIEFGQADAADKNAYCVRDDGAGFDMEYAGKLFAPFQRLHSTEEFPGNGIGLAIVHRIIHRHGGTVWAEGAVERGAMFYFSLD